MYKIGILTLDVFRSPKDYDFLFFQFKNSYFGYKYVIQNIDKNIYTIDFLKNISNINKYDFVLCSIISFEDYYLFLKVFKDFDYKKKKCKIIIGGSGVLNVIPLYKYIDIAAFGRVDGDDINKILRGEFLDNVWVKNNDKYLIKKYKVGQLKDFINIDPDLRLDAFDEKSIGCKKKCFFCNYTYKYKLKQKKSGGDFDSGYKNRETTFEDLNWDTNGRYLVCAIDANEEKKRFLINKNISNETIKNKILERDSVKKGKSIQVKLYNIYGYPFERVDQYNYDEINDILNFCDSKLKEKICFLLHCTHFVPMPLTPLENEVVNNGDFKSIFYKFDGKKIKLIKTYTSGGNAGAKRHTLINRLKIDDLDCFLKNKKHEVLNKYYDEFYDVLLYIEKPKIIDKHKIVYKNRVKSIIKESEDEILEKMIK